MDGALMDEVEGAWGLPVDGAVVSSCCFDHALTLYLDNDVVFRIEQPFVYTTDAGATHHLFPEGEPSALSPVLSVCRRALRRGRASESGELALEFLDGSLLVVPVSPEGEPWEMSGPDGSRVVSLPGGGLATWNPTSQ